MKIKPFTLLLFCSVALVGCKTQSQENGVGSQQADPHAAHHAAHPPAGSPPDAASIAAARINQTSPPGPAPEGMVWVPGGTFWINSIFIVISKRWPLQPIGRGQSLFLGQAKCEEE